MKRHKTVIKAAARVSKKIANTNYVVVGGGKLENELQNLCIHYQLGDRFHFVGSQENVVPYISIFDIGVNCSANEGLSNAIMEYMMYGVPCIVSRAGGNEELIKNGVNGLTFELDNDRELAEHIIRMILKPNETKKFISESKKEISKKYGIGNMMNEYDALFNKLLNMYEHVQS